MKKIEFTESSQIKSLNLIAAMNDGTFKVELPKNEPIYDYAPGDQRRASILKKLSQVAEEKPKILSKIAGKEIKAGEFKPVVMPHAHQHVLGELSLGSERELLLAADAALEAKTHWQNAHWKERVQVFLKAADLIAGPYRDTLNAATMLGQSKSIYQAEIDSACELIDFLRFNAYFYQKIMSDQPLSTAEVWNGLEYRPLDGFVLAITPFNFTAIAGNLPAAPAMLGNTVVWKPSDTQTLSAYYTMKIFEEAGMPPGVINFVPADGPLTSKVLLNHPQLGGVHFTGSTQTFQSIYQTVGQSVNQYKQYPRLVGETGGKDFVFAHRDCDQKALMVALLRGAFEYQGQKCSAASRAFIPKSIWNNVKVDLIDSLKTVKMGDVRDFSCFMNAVIDERSFNKISIYLDFIKNSNDAQILFGGKGNKAEGFFIEPTVVETTNPKFKTLKEEIFGPVLTVYPYEDSAFEETIDLCNEGSPYALTGAIFANDEKIIAHLTSRLRHAAGNFYINDKPTGAVVGQQPFGGGRASGTNDKAGSLLNLLRWISPRTIKQNFNPPKDYRYPFMS